MHKYFRSMRLLLHRFFLQLFAKYSLCIKSLQIQHNKCDMTVLTALLIVATLCLAPLKICLRFCLNTDDKTCTFQVRTFGLRIMNEKLKLEGKYLVCSGTVEETVDLSRSQANGFAQCITVDELQLTFCVNGAGCSRMILNEFVAWAIAAVGCATKCNVHTSTRFSLTNAVNGRCVVSVSLAEILANLVCNGAKRSLG